MENMAYTNRPLRVFLCHSSNDKPLVRELYQKLRAENWIQPWLDEEELYPGQGWEVAIEKAVEKSDAVLICLSNSSITKRGFVQKELRFVLDIALEIPEEDIFIIPLRLEECQPPRSLQSYQYANYFPESQRGAAFDKLLKSLRMRFKSLGLTFVENSYIEVAPTESVVDANVTAETRNQSNDIKEKSAQKNEINLVESPIYQSKFTLSTGTEFVCVPTGVFLMGEEDIINIPYDYWIARFPVTNEQYSQYTSEKKINHPVKDWMNRKNHPVTNVSWNDALEYCQWLSHSLKNELPSPLTLRLPTEAEWEKAARGIDGRIYPWGDTFDNNKCNSYEEKKWTTTPVGYYSPQGDSIYGCSDMAGNVWEWTHSLFVDYRYNVFDGREDEKTIGRRVLRGGSYDCAASQVECAVRGLNYPIAKNTVYGFRVVISTAIM
jgi:formylglycine-generating enzyme required for sulfatase activity